MLLAKQRVQEYLSTSATEQYPTWEEGASYLSEEIVVFDKYLYKSVPDENIGLLPPENLESWVRWGSSNKYAAIDLQANTTTKSQVGEPLEIVLSSPRYDVLALGNVLGSALTIEIYRASEPDPIEVYEQQINVRTCVDSWYSYFYCPVRDNEIDPQTTFLYRPPLVTGKIKITLTPLSASSVASIGYLIAGYSKFIGCTQFGSKIDINDYSIKKIDDFGVTAITKRESTETQDIDVSFPAIELIAKKKIIRDHLGEIVLCVVNEDIQTHSQILLLMGYVDGFTVVLDTPTQIFASMTIEETI